MGLGLGQWVSVSCLGHAPSKMLSAGIGYRVQDISPFSFLFPQSPGLLRLGFSDDDTEIKKATP